MKAKEKYQNYIKKATKLGYPIKSYNAFYQAVIYRKDKTLDQFIKPRVPKTKEEHRLQAKMCMQKRRQRDREREIEIKRKLGRLEVLTIAKGFRQIMKITGKY